MALTFDPTAIAAQLGNRYMKLPIAQKIAAPALLIFCIWAVVFASRIATQGDYAVLYSDLASNDAAAVVQKLKDLKVPYKLEGNSISISPPSQIHELRLTLAAEGVPKTGTVGFELFDGTNFATTTMGEMVKKQRALQGELERTIMSLDAVLVARVHISQPEKTIFAKQAQETGASVLLKLKPGSELDKKQIKGIANFVATGIEGLKPENVTIIDESGNLLTSKNGEGEDFGIDATRLQYVREVERGYVQRIESMLSQVLGPGRVVARVTADVDFSSNEREEESYDPGSKVIRSERSVEEGIGIAQRGGVPGVVSNLSNDLQANANAVAAAEQNSRKENVKNFEVSRAIVRSAQARGKLVRLSTAVLIDGKYTDIANINGDGKGAGKIERNYQPLSSEMLTQVEGVVKSAVGFDATRGDVVTVENMPFFGADENLNAELAKAHQDIQYYNYGGTMIAVLVLLLFFLFVVRPLVKFLTTNTQDDLDLSKLLPGEFAANDLDSDSAASRERAREISASSDQAAAEATSASKRPGIEGIESVIDLEQFDEVMAENARLVKENPQQAALLIRYWLNDGKI